MLRRMETTIATERLQLRMFGPADLDAYAAMSADAEVMRHIGEGGPIGRDMAWRGMAGFLGHWALRGYGMWAIEERASASLIGRAGFITPEGWPGLELGWLLARDAWGRGYATEACVAALAHGRQRFGAQELISLITRQPALHRSGRAPGRHAGAALQLHGQGSVGLRPRAGAVA